MEAQDQKAVALVALLHEELGRAIVDALNLIEPEHRTYELPADGDDREIALAASEQFREVSKPINVKVVTSGDPFGRPTGEVLIWPREVEPLLRVHDRMAEALSILSGDRSRSRQKIVQRCGSQ